MRDAAAGDKEYGGETEENSHARNDAAQLAAQEEETSVRSPDIREVSDN